MARLIKKEITATLRRQLTVALGPESFSRPMVVKNTWEPDKTKGTYITFADGTKFRRATAHSRAVGWIELGSAQNTQAKTTSQLPAGQPGYAISSPGGFRGDRVFDTSNQAAFRGVLGMTTIYGPPEAPSAMQNEAVTKALLKLADQKAMIGENLATLRQTLGLIRNPAEALVKGVRKVHSDKSLAPFLYKSYRDILRGGLMNGAAKRYLEYVYGWKPLMQDIHGIMELAKQKGDSPLLMHSTGKSSQQTQTRLYRYKDLSNDTTTLTGPCDVNATTRCSLWARIDPNQQGVRSLNQLGLLNPAALAWELVPWSFVVDWLLPIGSVLNALSAPAGLIFVDGSISHRVKTVGPYSHRWDYFDTGYSITSDVSAGGTVRYEGYNRTQLFNWPLPGLWVDSDPFRGDRWMKALALTILSMRSLR